MPGQYVLYESASGYALFEVVEAEEISALKPEVQAAVTDLARFSNIVKLKAFHPFSSAENALANANDISEGIVTSDLAAFLESKLPKSSSGKKPKYYLGVQDPKIGTAIQEGLSIPCNSNDTLAEIYRGIRLHFDRYVDALAGGMLEKAQLGLAHSYSRAKVKFNVNRSDNMIIQAIALLDQLDKDLNTFAMRVREWYGWHFPELAKIVKDNFVYARVAHAIGSRSTFTMERVPEITAIVLDEDVANAVFAAARTSMGMDISDTDLANVDHFTSQLVSLGQYRLKLAEYLRSKMSIVAPNLGALIGDVVGARLISHAGSLTNLAKAPASTVQILGAEKALFRALKTKGNTPKYGLIFHSTFIGRAAAKNKGRISRYLANKCSIAARLDAFSDKVTTKFGERLRDQVEDRLKFYETGETPPRNAEVMAKVIAELRSEEGDEDAEASSGGRMSGTKRGRDRRSADDDDEDEEVRPSRSGILTDADAAFASAKKEKKEKKEKKSKKSSREEAEVEEGDEDATPAPKSRSRAGAGGVDEDDEESAPKSSSKKDKKHKKEKKHKRHDDSDDE